MTSLSENSSLKVQPEARFQLDIFEIEILVHEGQFLDVHYFKVNFWPSSESSAPESSDTKLGLLRVGSCEGGLKRELSIRNGLGEVKMVAALHGFETKENVLISAQPLGNKADLVNTLDTESGEEESDLVEKNFEGSIIIRSDNEKYLEEEFLEPTSSSSLPEPKLLLLSDYPISNKSLCSWLEQEQSLESILLIASQVCQFFRYLYQRQWCFVQIFPQYVEVGLPSLFFDLSGVYAIGEKLETGIETDYSAPELLYQHPVDEKMGTYLVGTLLYQAIHRKRLSKESDLSTEIDKIPKIYQILNICLSPIDERFPLDQLLSLLIEARKQLSKPNVQWQTASYSTLGLSTSRLQNEDSYGIRQQQSSLDQSFLLAAIADGMGGMAQGEVASQLAIRTLMSALIADQFKEIDNQSEWLISMVHKANEAVINAVEDGGTTLSAVLAVDQSLMLAHVGDSRVFLIRYGEIQQLSEDHSMVAMLVASGQITYEESLTHPDRNMLLKSLGSKRTLSEGYVQDLRSSGSISKSLEDGDIILLCSDGVWDLASPDILLKIFSDPNYSGLHTMVSAVFKEVLSKGANDNATLLALQCSISINF